jgi:hypothetical protein
VKQACLDEWVHLHMSPLEMSRRLVTPATPESRHHTRPSSSWGGPRHPAATKSLLRESERGSQKRVDVAQRERLGTFGYGLLDVYRPKGSLLSYVLSTSNLG